MYRPNEIHSLLQWGGDFLCLYEINVTKPFSTHRVIAPGRGARLWGGGAGEEGERGICHLKQSHINVFVCDR